MMPEKDQGINFNETVTTMKAHLFNGIQEKKFGLDEK
jgi:hypothetical protein